MNGPVRFRFSHSVWRDGSREGVAGAAGAPLYAATASVIEAIRLGRSPRDFDPSPEDELATELASGGGTILLLAPVATELADLWDAGNRAVRSALLRVASAQAAESQGRSADGLAAARRAIDRLERFPDERLARAAAHSTLGRLSDLVSDYESGRAAFRTAFDLAPTDRAEGRAVAAAAAVGLGEILRRQGNQREALVQLEHGLRLSREARTPRVEAAAQHAIGWVRWAEGSPDAARTAYAAAIRTYRAAGDPGGAAGTVAAQAWDEWSRGNYDKASAGLAEALAVHRETSDRRPLSE